MSRWQAYDMNGDTASVLADAERALELRPETENLRQLRAALMQGLGRTAGDLD